MTLALVASARLKSIGAPEVEFRAVGPVGLKIDGHSPQLSASERDGKLTIVAPLTNLKTGISLRDRHLREHLDTAKYPDARLTVERSKLTMPADNKTVTGSAVGQFTMHGVTRPERFRYRALRTGSDYHVQGLTQLDIRDFSVKVPCYLGVCVRPTVKIKVKFKLREMQ